MYGSTSPEFSLQIGSVLPEDISMNLSINGATREFTEPSTTELTLAALVEQLGMKSDRVAIELNREIVPRASWSETKLNEGDRLEIVHFVGGGTP